MVIAHLCGFGKGYAAGIGAGALTATAMMGIPGDALNRIGLAPDWIAQLTSRWPSDLPLPTPISNVLLAVWGPVIVAFTEMN